MLAAALLAGATCAFLIALAPPAGDEPAHLYRTMLARDGVWVWDTLWYGGDYPFASYSLLYYLPAALVGDTAVAAAAVVAAAALFAWICVVEWGAPAVWPSRSFAVLGCAPLFTGTYAWAVGLAFCLGSLRALQADRAGVGIACGALAVWTSPLAFVFLCVTLLAVAAARRPSRRTAIAVAAGLAVPAGIQLAVNVLFPSEGRYEFRVNELALVLVVAALGWAVARRSPEGRLLVGLLALVGIVCVLAYLIPSPFGSNLTRFRTFAFPVLLLAAGLAGFRPRLLVVPALVAAFAYNVTPYATVAPDLTDTRAAHAGFWAPALDFLRRHGGPQYRVDVVPTFDNWEAYYVPRAGFALARGWYRQLDLARNPVLYEDDLTAPEYRRWLRSLGVRYVLLPHVPLDRLASRRQAEILRSGRSGLVEVLDAPAWTIYELPAATPILTGPAPSRLTAVGHQRLEGWAGAPGAYLLRVRYTPYWTVAAGDACLEEGPGGMTRLEVRRAGAFALAVPDARTLLDTVLGARPGACGDRYPAAP